MDQRTMNTELVRIWIELYEKSLEITREISRILESIESVHTNNRQLGQRNRRQTFERYNAFRRNHRNGTGQVRPCRRL